MRTCRGDPMTAAFLPTALALALLLGWERSSRSRPRQREKLLS